VRVNSQSHWVEDGRRDGRFARSRRSDRSAGRPGWLPSALRSKRTNPFREAWYTWILGEADNKCRLKKAQDDAAAMTAEVAASKMTPEEAKRLSRVRNIGIAV
jgi:hypothetical protein